MFTDRPGVLTNDFFVNLLDMSTEWKLSQSDENVYDGFDRGSGQAKADRHRQRSGVRLEPALRALAEVWRPGRRQGEFVRDFAAAWASVMNNDRFDPAWADWLDRMTVGLRTGNPVSVHSPHSRWACTRDESCRCWR